MIGIIAKEQISKGIFGYRTAIYIPHPAISLSVRFGTVGSCGGYSISKTKEHATDKAVALHRKD